MLVNSEGGEAILRNEHGDTIIVPRNKRSEAMKALLKDDHKAIDALALQLPKAERYAAGGTVVGGDPIVNSTKLSKQDEINYQIWKGKLSSNLQYEGDYDLRGFYKENPNFNQNDPKQHITDKWKLPNHPTFSNESKYYNNTTSQYGGVWKNGNEYHPNNPINKNRIIEDENGSQYLGPETTITAKRPEKSIGNFFRRWGYEHSKEGSDSLLGAIGSGFGAALQLPQAAATYILDPKGNVKPGKALTENGFNKTSIMNSIGKYAATHNMPNDLSGMLTKAVGTEEGQNVLLDPLLLTSEIAKGVSKGSELIGKGAKITESIKDIINNIPETTKLAITKGEISPLDILNNLRSPNGWKMFGTKFYNKIHAPNILSMSPEAENTHLYYTPIRKDIINSVGNDYSQIINKLENLKKDPLNNNISNLAEIETRLERYKELKADRPSNFDDPTIQKNIADDFINTLHKNIEFFNTEEGAKRLKNYGITDPKDFTTFLLDEVEYSFEPDFKDGSAWHIMDNRLNTDFNQLAKLQNGRWGKEATVGNLLDHELGHAMQSYAKKEHLINNQWKTVDNYTKDPGLRKFFNQDKLIEAHKNIHKTSNKYSFANKLIELEDFSYAHEYPEERFAFLREFRNDLLKNSETYDKKITMEDLNKNIKEYPDGRMQRLLKNSPDSEKNMILKHLNKLPTVITPIIAGALANKKIKNN